jgi:peroxiredoxin family protein
MRLGIVVTDESFLPHANALLNAAVARGWEPQCFLTDTGVNLLADAGFVERARARPNSISLCEHSAERYAAGRFDLNALADIVIVGGQYQDAELVRKCDKVLVF